MITFETFNEQGRKLADIIERELTNVSHNSLPEAIIYIGALGICVRKIKDIINDKYTDPAVICVDTTGRYVIPVLSGHVGGANNLARIIARITGGEAVITTQSDNAGLWALDTLAHDNGWGMVSLSREEMNKAIATFVNREKTALLLDWHDNGTQHLIDTCPEHVTIINSIAEYDASAYKLLIIVSPRKYPDTISTLHFTPRCLHVGIGLAHQAEPVDGIINEMSESIIKAGYTIESIADFNTIDIKAGEPVVKRLIDDGFKFNFYTADELSVMDVPTPSTTVEKHVGTPSVAEAAALKAGGSMILPKQKGNNWTLALASSEVLTTNIPHGHIEIVGAGPGDPELVSVRGKRFLQQADLILYAGSLVPRELTYYAKPGCVVRSSASMNLEEQFAIMKEFYDRGKLVVRLHTGDPCIYGAIQEQMAFFDEYGMDYHITPGISSFLAAAAELRSQFTIPERCQSIILTRGEGRTPMPEKEKLHMLAAHQSTMCIFLSASIVDNVQRQLLEGGYPPETPVAACYKLTWKDQRIYRGQLKDLAKILKENNLTLTTMIVVGEAIDNREGLSKLYDGHFTHMFRNGK